MPPRTESWSNLPPELLVTIAHQHSSQLDVLRFRSICRSWRNAISCRRPSDSSIWSVRIPFPVIHLKDLCSLTRSTVCYIESFALRKRWLVKIEEFEEGRLRSLDPVSLIRMIGFPKELNLVDCRVFEIARSFSFGVLEGKKPLWDLNMVSKKVVVSSVDGNVKNGDLVLVLSDDGSLLHIRIGDEKLGEVKEWQIMKLHSDVIFRNDRFYVVDGEGGLVIVDKRLNVEICPWLGALQNICEEKYLIEGGGRLFLVIRKILSAREDCREDSRVGQVSEEEEASSVWFEVFCLNEKEKDWIQVYSLDELAFFVADDCSFSVVARDFPPYQQNCIYYADHDVGDSKRHNCGIFNLDKK